MRWVVFAALLLTRCGAPDPVKEPLAWFVAAGLGLPVTYHPVGKQNAYPMPRPAPPVKRVGGVPNDRALLAFREDLRAAAAVVRGANLALGCGDYGGNQVSILQKYARDFVLASFRRHKATVEQPYLFQGQADQMDWEILGSAAAEPGYMDESTCLTVRVDILPQMNKVLALAQSRGYRSGP